MKNVADVYPLSPMQESMLLHALSAGADKDVLLNQFCYELNGTLDTDALRGAWQQLLDRHPALRSAFLWENLKQPVQVVRQQLDVPFEILDWRGHPPAWHAAELERFRCQDRARGFDPARAPLMRVTLMRLDDARYYLVWSSHHLLLDRWCLATLYPELFACYEAARSGRASALAPVRPYRDYITWLQQQPPAEAEAYWRAEMGDLEQAARLTEGRAGGGAPTSAGYTLAPAEVRALREFARRHRLTPNTLAQGGLALLVNRLTGAQDVVFGATVSGRPPALPGVDAIVGSFINNVPVRARLGADATLVEWLQSQQLAQQRRTGYEHVSPAAIHRWSSLPPQQRLFDTLLVWLAPPGEARASGLEVRPLPGALATAYPLTLSVAETGEELDVQAVLGDGYRTPVPLAELAQCLGRTLHEIAASDEGCRLAELDGFTGRRTFDAPSPAPAPSTVRSDEPDTARVAGREAFEAGYLEDMLVNEWRDLLGIDDFGKDDNFFDLGGESLLAATLHARIEAGTRKCIPLLTLFHTPTIRAMTAVVKAGDWPLHAQVAVPIRARGTEAPLFCIASPEVNTLGYTLLHRHLKQERPVYVLQTPPDSEQVRVLSPAELPALARRYVEALRGVREHGPYHFVARCTGAHLAVEMARQLVEEGETVAFLGIINTWSYHTVSRLYHLHRFVNVLYYYGDRLRDLARQGPRALLVGLARRARGAGAGTVATTPGAGAAAPAPARASADLQVGWASGRGSEVCYAGELTVFRTARQRYWRVRDEALGWNGEAESVRVVRLPGERPKSLLREPWIRNLAAQIEMRLARSAARRAGGVVNSAHAAASTEARVPDRRISECAD